MECVNVLWACEQLGVRDTALVGSHNERLAVVLGEQLDRLEAGGRLLTPEEPTRRQRGGAYPRGF